MDKITYCPHKSTQCRVNKGQGLFVFVFFIVFVFVFVGVFVFVYVPAVLNIGATELCNAASVNKGQGHELLGVIQAQVLPDH